jgi:cytidylate kinase
MNLRGSSERLSEALVRATGHWGLRGGTPGEAPARPFTIALSREAGARGTTVAEEVGRRLGWPVYDRQLVEKIAQEMGLRTTLVESVDERNVSWVRETLEAFSTTPPVSATAYFHHLIETVLSLGARGECVIVGRGAPQILPAETTLRVRLVAPPEERVAVMTKELGVTPQEAARRVRVMDEERQRFIREHFRKDPTDPLVYDLVLHTGRFTVNECADLIVAALYRLQGRATEPAAKTASRG